MIKLKKATYSISRDLRIGVAAKLRFPNIIDVVTDGLILQRRMDNPKVYFPGTWGVAPFFPWRMASRSTTLKANPLDENSRIS